MIVLFFLAMTFNLFILCCRLNKEGTGKELRRTILCRYTILYLMYMGLLALTILLFYSRVSTEIDNKKTNIENIIYNVQLQQYRIIVASLGMAYRATEPLILNELRLNIKAIRIFCTGISFLLNCCGKKDPDGSDEKKMSSRQALNRLIGTYNISKSKMEKLINEETLYSFMNSSINIELVYLILKGVTSALGQKDIEQ